MIYSNPEYSKNLCFDTGAIRWFKDKELYENNKIKNIKAGVLSELSSAFADENVSLHSVIQKGIDSKNGKKVTLVLVTHNCKEGNVQNAITRCASGIRLPKR